MPRLLVWIGLLVVARCVSAADGRPLLENVQRRLSEARDKKDRLELLLDSYQRYRQQLAEMARFEGCPTISYEGNLSYCARQIAGREGQLRRDLEKIILLMQYLEDERARAIVLTR